MLMCGGLLMLEGFIVFKRIRALVIISLLVVRMEPISCWHSTLYLSLFFFFCFPCKVSFVLSWLVDGFVNSSRVRFEPFLGSAKPFL